MIELKNNKLEISFPEVHKDAKTSIDFKRTLRIPNDGNTYPLPAGLGNFPLHHIEDFSETIPDNWKHHGGVMLPMYQSEALWINFSNRNYPIAIKIGTGKINAINGREWRSALNFKNQDYVVSSEQPWIDGFKIEEGIIRQFVAAPLGSGLTVEEQITGEAEFGGLQIEAFPLKAEAWEKILKRRKLEEEAEQRVYYCMAEPEMGFGMGGKMRQHIYADEHNPSDWDFLNSNRCFVHVLNSINWKEVTGQNPPDLPLTKNDYELENIPWFEYYSETKALKGTNIFSKLKTIKLFNNERAITPKSTKKIYSEVSEWNDK